MYCTEIAVASPPETEGRAETESEREKEREKEEEKRKTGVGGTKKSERGEKERERGAWRTQCPMLKINAFCFLAVFPISLHSF